MKKLRKISSVALLVAASASVPVQAEMFWSDNSVSVLHSADYYNVGYAFGAPNKKIEHTTLTLEHASGHDWGDAFFFLDRHNGKGSNSSFNETYSELSPRFSLSNLTGESMEFGPLKDVLIATTYEFGSNNSGFSQDNYLYGVGLKWSVPGFAFFNTNIFYANNENVDDDMQLTLTYGVPFSAGELNFMFDGYIDWSSAENDHASDFHFNPQLRADLSPYFGITKSKLEAGFEYSYWSNKFGVKSDEDESAFSAIVKYHL